MIFRLKGVPFEPLREKRMGRDRPPPVLPATSQGNAIGNQGQEACAVPDGKRRHVSEGDADLIRKTT